LKNAILLELVMSYYQTLMIESEVPVTSKWQH